MPTRGPRLARIALGTDNVDCQLGDGLPAEVLLGLPRATIDQAAAAPLVITLAPDIKEELPVLYLRLRHAAVERRRPHRRADPPAHRPVALRRAHPALPRRARWRLWPAPSPARRPSTTTWPASPPPTSKRRAAASAPAIERLVAGDGGAVHRGDPGPAHRVRVGRRGGRSRQPSGRPAGGGLPPRPAPVQRPRRPRHGPGPRACCPAGSASTPAGDWYARPVGRAAAQPQAGSTPPGCCERRPPAASAAWSWWGPTRSPTSPTPTWPAGGSRARASWWRRLLRQRLRPPRRRRPARGHVRGAAGHVHQPGRSPHVAGAEGDGARRGLARLDDRHRAGGAPRP